MIDLETIAEEITSDIMWQVRNHDRRGRDCSFMFDYNDKSFYVAYDWEGYFTPLEPNYIDGMIESYSGGELSSLDVSITDAGYYNDKGEWHELTEPQISTIQNLVKP